LEPLRGILDARPAHLADVQQAVGAAEIEQTLRIRAPSENDSLADLALRKAPAKVSRVFFAFLFQQGTAAHDKVLPRHHLGHETEKRWLTNCSAFSTRTCRFWLMGMKRGLPLTIDAQPAFVGFDYAGFDNIPVATLTSSTQRRAAPGEQE